jgi:hypothetical protein
VGVAGHDDLEAGRCGVQVEFLEIVENENARMVRFYYSPFRQGFCPRAPIDVAAHCNHGRDLTQPVQNFEFSDVAGMDD